MYMETSRKGSHSKPILSQTQNNTTLWIGHLQTEAHDHQAGQTFTCPSDGLLNNIQVYSSAVTCPGELRLTLHEFDRESKTWGPPIAGSGVVLQKNDEARWIRFELEPLTLKKDACYGFRLQTEDAFIGLGEAVSHAKKPFAFGLSWMNDTRSKIGKYFNYFSLAFKVEMCA